MSDTLRIKRRLGGGAAGAPTTLATAELAYNENDSTLYYGFGDNGSHVANNVVPIAGSGYAQPKVTISDTAPSAPQIGQLWFDSVGAKMYIFWNDGTSSQWTPT